jgi:hypothetical protein
MYYLRRLGLTLTAALAPPFCSLPGEEREIAGWYKVGVEHIEWSERGIVWESKHPHSE